MATRHIRRARFFGDDRDIITLPISTPTSAIEVGDFVYWTGTAAISFTDISDQGTKAQNQAYAKAGFAGVAITRVAAGTTSGNVTVATRGVFEGTCTSASYVVGGLLGPIGTGTASAVGVSPTSVETVATAALAIAKVAKAGTTVTTLQYEIMGTLTIVPPVGTSTATDTIAESTPGAGVTVDSVLLQDGSVSGVNGGFSGDLTVEGVATFSGTISMGADFVFADDQSLILGDGSDAELLWSTADASNHAAVLALGNTSQQIHITDVGAKATDWNVSASTDPELYIHSNTTPATDYIRIGGHTGTVADIDMVGGTTLQFKVGGTIEASITAAGVVLPSGNSLQTATVIELVAASGVTVDGAVIRDGAFHGVQGAPTAETGVATISAADILSGIVTLTHTAGATVALTLDTGANMTTGAPASFGVNSYIDWYLINLSAAAVDTGTLTSPGASHTIVGNPIVQSAHSSTGGIYGNSAHFRSRQTAADTWITYRIG